MIGRYTMSFQISFNINTRKTKCSSFIVNMSALFIPTSVAQNLLPPAELIELKESPIQITESPTFLTYASVPFQHHALMMPSMNAMRYDFHNRQSRMFAVINYYNNNPQPPGTILLFQDWVSVIYGLEHTIVRYERYSKNTVSRPEQPPPPPPSEECAPPRRSGRKTRPPKKYSPDCSPPKKLCSPFVNNDPVWANPL